MHTEMTDEQYDTLDEDVSKLLSDETVRDLKKALSDAVAPVWDDVVFHLKEDTQSNYRDVATAMAQNLIDDVLAGKEGAAEKIFGLTAYDGREYHSIIHGNIHEPSSILLRRRLVEAHADLLRDARVKDLEALVEKMRSDMAQLRAENERFRR